MSDKLFHDTAAPTGVIKLPQPLTDTEAAELRKAFVRKHGRPYWRIMSKNNSPLAAREVLQELENESPGTAAELYLVTYDDRGQEVGQPQPGDEVLSAPFFQWGTLQTYRTLIIGANSLTERIDDFGDLVICQTAGASTPLSRPRR